VRFSRRYVSGLVRWRWLIDSAAKGSAANLMKGIPFVMKLDIAILQNYIEPGPRHHFVLALNRKG